MTIRTVLPPLLLALGLAACATGSDRAGLADPTAAILPTEQYSIEVRPRPTELRLALHPNGLSAQQQAAVADLIGRWRSQGSAYITVQAPSQADPQLAGATVEATRATLVRYGVAPDRVQVVSYTNAKGVQPSVIVGFAGYEAVGPQCGQVFENWSAKHDNTPPANYGCATTANFAAQLANPGDLISPRAMSPADATRRANVIDKYRRGETTSGARDDQANGTLSTVGGN
jgi:pilus assembly protein CpaD